MALRHHPQPVFSWREPGGCSHWATTAAQNIELPTYEYSGKYTHS